MYRINLKMTRLFLIILIFVIPASAQYFGQNKVQYQAFDWHFLQSEHFDVYFYRGSYDLAVFVANEAEQSYRKLEKDFQYEITDRISIILYKSHNDWQQTNVVDVYLSEGIGGVTELFKNRVVVPFEGSYSQLRHVLHHELVHGVMNDMLYGGSIQSLVSGQVIPVPLWFAEGLAEYFSVGWDVRADMIVRDATINNRLPPIMYLDYYMAYQGGMSVFRYIARKYGHEKIAEILHKIKGSFRFEGAFKSALGIELKELSEEWQKQMRKDFWPAINKRDETEDFARPLTDHMEEQNYLNISPALSPNGDKVVFLSNMDGKIAIYLMDVLEQDIEGKLIEGESDVDFEELHWLSPGMSWSPDGRKVTFSAKAGDQDALYIIDIIDEDVRQFKFNLDGIFSAAWSPKGDEIAFIGNLNEASDVFIFDIQKESIRNLTNDVFTDDDPSWSSDGERIIFTSDRGEYINGDTVPEGFLISEFDYENTDIYIINRFGDNIIRVTDTKSRETSPLFSPDDKKLMYVSDESGVNNIYIHNLDTDNSYPVSNLITGAFQLSTDRDGRTLAFSSFFEGGWDIYTIKNPFELDSVEIEPTDYILNREEELSDTLQQDKETLAVEEEEGQVPRAADFSNFVFADMGSKKAIEEVDVEIDTEEYKLEDGHYKVRNYRVKFSPDVIYGAAQYNTLWGFQGYTQLAFSDVLGNHKIYLGTNLVFDLRNSYLTGQYWYLANRTNYGVHVYHYANTYLSYNYGFIRYRNYGISLTASRPFSKFTRINLTALWFNVSQEYLAVDFPEQKLESIIPGIELVHDNSEWGYLGPKNGFRGSLGLIVSPKYSEHSFEFTTVKLDLRKYFEIADNYSFAFRFAGGVSMGAEPQVFFLGGVPYWFNPEYSDGSGGDARGPDVSNIKNVYFSEFIMPLRGARFYERIGNNFSLVNLEFRFPLIPIMQLGLPPITLGNIQGVLFTDVGSAWDKMSDFQGINDGRLDDIIAGYGMGARLVFFGLLFKYDVAWRFDLHRTWDPIQYFSMGIDF